MWYGQCVICDNVCNDHVSNLSRLACRWVRQPAGAIWLSIILCDLRVNESPCNCFSLSLRVAIVVVAIVGGHNHGDGATMLVMMEIMAVLWRWRSKAEEEKAIPCHNINCMWCLFFYAPYCLLGCDRKGSMIRWYLSLNIKIISPLVCTVAKVCRVEAPRDDRVW